MILVIGNKGSFSLECTNYLKKTFNNIMLIHTFELDYSNYTNCTKYLDNILDQKNSVKIVYVGGETKNANKMYLHNVEIPLLLSKFCKSRHFQFILLGSLSQWGLIKWNSKTDIYNNTPVFIPYDEYSQTKQLCFLKINSSTIYSGYFICPASILNHKHKSGSIYIFKKFMSISLINFIFQFKGMISYCERLDVFEAIKEALISNEFNNNIIVSKSIPAIQFTSYNANKFKLNFTYFLGYLLYYILYFLNLKKVSQKIVLLFTEINFISSNKNF